MDFPKRVSDHWVIARLNDIPIGRKLVGLFLFCVLIPLLITDTFVLWMLARYQKDSVRHDALNAAAYYLTSTIEDAAGTAQNLYLNKPINHFLDTDFQTPLDYYNDYRRLTDSLYANFRQGGRLAVTMYAENGSILNGGYFHRLDRQQAWYQALEQSGQNVLLLTNYDDNHTVSVTNLRQISVVRRMNYDLRSTVEKVVKIDISYSRMEQDFRAANYDADLYVCMNGLLVCSNVLPSDWSAPFAAIPPSLVQKSRGIKTLNLYGCDMEIYAIDRSMDMGHFFRQNWPLLLLLSLLNLLLPSVFIFWINRSFIDRLRALTATVRRADNGTMPLLEQVQGQDEIGMLMGTYNEMARHMNQLIETVYKVRLREQETDLARQQAELLALRSQINPHFLFNLLESIRMQSLLREEKKTAEMIGMLAYIERQYVDWGADVIPLREELRCAETYLQLQRYRLGDRFSYRIDVQPGCGELQIPKLSLLTFVENACLHGVAKKGNHGWIFVRVRRQGDAALLEVEDTGIGMTEGQQREMQEEMNRASIEMLKGRHHVGVINACLRLKRTASGSVRFTVEGEEGIDTTITIILEEGDTDGKQQLSESTAGG